MTRKTLCLLCLLAGAVAAASRAAEVPSPQTNTVSAGAVSPKDVVAKGKGFQITRGQLDNEVDRAKAQLGRTVVREETDELFRRVLEQLINVRLLEAGATAADKAAGKEKAEKRLAEAQAKAGSEEAFDRELKRLGVTRAELLAKWSQALTADMVVKRDLKIKVTDADVRKEYDDNPNRFQAPETVRASHILLATRDPKTGLAFSPDQQAAKRKQAEAVLKRARAGEDFAKLAREFSEDPVSKDKGGEYTFARGQMVPEVENAAFALNTGEISDIVTSSYGFHIIRLNERIPSQKIKFADASADIRNALTQQAIGQKFSDYIASLRKEAGVEILDAKLQPLPIADPNTFLPPIRGYQLQNSPQGK